MSANAARKRDRDERRYDRHELQQATTDGTGEWLRTRQDAATPVHRHAQPRNRHDSPAAMRAPARRVSCRTPQNADRHAVPEK